MTNFQVYLHDDDQLGTNILTYVLCPIFALKCQENVINNFFQVHYPIIYYYITYKHLKYYYVTFRNINLYKSDHSLIYDFLHDYDNIHLKCQKYNISKL